MFLFTDNHFLSFLIILNEETHLEDSDYVMYEHVLKKLMYTRVIMLSFIGGTKLF